jgi:flagellar hook protein FlgE
MSFQQGLSGLSASARNLEVIGHNIANANTIGAKASRAEFADLYAISTVGGLSNTPGIGVGPGTIAQQFNQGGLTSTGNALDLAINGGGFFQVTDESNPTQFSRNGQFKLDKDGYVVNNQGLKLMGYPATAAGQIQPGVASALKLPTGGVDPAATTASILELNLDSRVAATTTALTPAAATIDIQDPDTYNNATSSTVYDVKGQPVTLTYYFQKAGTDQWNVYATANGQSINGITTPAESVNAMAPIATITFPPTGGNPIQPPGAIGDVTPYTYATTGTQTAGTPVTADGTITLPTIPAITLTAGGTSEPILATTLNLKGLTQYGAGFGVTNVEVDGNAPGSLSGLNVEADGTLTARYSNGKTKAAGQLELVNFRNPNGLQPVGGNAWTTSAASGDPVRNVPGQGNLGLIQSGALEESNVDLTAELVNMMTAQRMYQANAQTIKTEDQIMNTLVNLR